MATIPRLTEHLTDLAERLARLVTACELMERGDRPVDVASLCGGLEKAHAHAEGLLQEVRESEAAK